MHNTVKLVKVAINDALPLEAAGEMALSEPKPRRSWGYERLLVSNATTVDTVVDSDTQAGFSFLKD